MRIQTQERLLELLTTIQDGFLYMKNIAPEYQSSLLQDCYQGIETFTTVLRQQLSPKAFSKYEETIGLLHKNHSLDCLNDKNNIYASCKTVERLSHLLKHEPEVKLEIVFMPYKISMWDCMESVWRAIQKDKGCICHVVPIPFYERNSDGSQGKLCYEGDRFPPEICVLHYMQYSTEIHKPDVIYIHNPYDGQNLVTSVLPEYYSANLKQHTRCLTYIPYFLAGPYSSTESASAFCATPGAQNADVIIAQSEAHKKAFIGCGISERKVYALGNPKVDKILKLPSNPVEIPKRWKEVGCGKKVFLYCSSLTNFLTYPKAIQSLIQNIRLLAEHDQAMVIWRPHPLMLASIHSMRSDQITEAKDLWLTIDAMPNVLIDENDDAYPSMQFCDAMISEYSSLLFQFGLSGKPVLSLNGSRSLYTRKQIAYLSLNYYDYTFLLESDDRPGTSIEDFRDMVVCGQDPNRQKRVKTLKDSLVNCNGSCGEKIHHKIKEILLKKKG